MQGMNRIFQFFLIIQLLTFSSCDVQNANRNKKEGIKEVEIRNQKLLRLPEILYEFTPKLGTSKVNSNDLFLEKNLYVLVYLSVSCVTCLRELELWQKRVVAFHSKNVPVYFIFHSYDNFNLFTFLFEAEGNTLPEAKLFFDIHKEFEALNPANFNNETDRVFLLDQNFAILVEGDSIKDPKFLENYIPNP